MYINFKKKVIHFTFKAILTSQALYPSLTLLQAGHANKGYKFGWQGSEHSVFVEVTFLIFKKRCCDYFILFPVVFVFQPAISALCVSGEGEGSGWLFSFRWKY